MTDLEITRLCAEAMGIDVYEQHDGKTWFKISHAIAVPYIPLTNNSQAMELVKKFVLSIGTEKDLTWSVYGEDFHEAQSKDLNRAICECVAKMQAAK